MPLEAREFYTPEELAALLRVHVLTIRRMIARGELPVLKVGRRYRIRGADILARIKAQGEEPGQEEE
jgi:excisionase family DNA binding protein